MAENPFEHIRFHGQTDVGRKRKNNEDDLGLFPEAGVFCVADGMGGGDDGEVASSSTVAAVSAFAAKCIPPAGFAYPFGEVKGVLKDCLSEISARINRRTAELGLGTCGSTFVGVCFDATNPSVAVALHAGDSRLYVIRGGAIRQVTRDHSPAAAVGEKDDRRVNSMFRGVILRAVGVHEFVDVEETPFDVKKGDRIVICSDGLYRMVDEKAIVETVLANDTPQGAVAALVAAANAAGGIDNITVELLEIGELPKPLRAVDMPDGTFEAVCRLMPMFDECCDKTISATSDTLPSGPLSSAEPDLRTATGGGLEDSHFTTEDQEEGGEKNDVVARIVKAVKRNMRMAAIGAILFKEKIMMSLRIMSRIFSLKIKPRTLKRKPQGEHGD